MPLPPGALGASLHPEGGEVGSGAGAGDGEDRLTESAAAVGQSASLPSLWSRL